jgi:hypothetical protein
MVLQFSCFLLNLIMIYVAFRYHNTFDRSPYKILYLNNQFMAVSQTWERVLKQSFRNGINVSLLKPFELVKSIFNVPRNTIYIIYLYIYTYNIIFFYPLTDIDVKHINLNSKLYMSEIKQNSCGIKDFMNIFQKSKIKQKQYFLNEKKLFSPWKVCDLYIQK